MLHPIGIFVATTLFEMKVYILLEVVIDNRAHEFDRRCREAMKQLDLTPQESADHSLFGTQTLDRETRNNYLSK